MTRYVVVFIGLVALIVALVVTSESPEPAPSAVAPPPVVALTVRPKPVAPSTAPSLTVPAAVRLEGGGITHEFLERRYDPPFELDVSHEGLPEGPFDSPEDGAAHHVAAMAHGLFDGPVAMLDEPERPVWRERLAARADALLAYWRTEVAGHRWTLTRRIDLPGYAIIYRKRDDRAENALPTAFKQDAQGRWWMTHELDGHPVYAYEHNGVATNVQIVSR